MSQTIISNYRRDHIYIYTSKHILLLLTHSFGLFSLHRDNGENGSAKGRYGLEAHQAHFRCYAVWGSSDKEEPLCREVWDYDHVAGMRDQLHEHVPCNDEVGEHEEDGS